MLFLIFASHSCLLAVSELAAHLAHAKGAADRVFIDKRGCVGWETAAVIFRRHHTLETASVSHQFTVFWLTEMLPRTSPPWWVLLMCHVVTISMTQMSSWPFLVSSSYCLL